MRTLIKNVSINTLNNKDTPLLMAFRDKVVEQGGGSSSQLIYLITGQIPDK